MLPLYSPPAPTAPLTPAQEDQLLQQEHLVFFHEHLVALARRGEHLCRERQRLHAQQQTAAPGSAPWVGLGQAYRAVAGEHCAVLQAWDEWREEYGQYQQEHRPRS